MTRQEAKVEQTIRALRITKELLEQDINVLPYCLDGKDGLGETVKVKRPKADKADKITNQTQKEQGFGLAGEENVGKALDSKQSMLDEIHDRWNDISMELNEGVTKESLAELINTLTSINLITDAEMVDDTFYDN
tara:strand:- start:195 stop:599 length:405 start_codon:yes stop_codon:yes gene_type:complete